MHLHENELQFESMIDFAEKYYDMRYTKEVIEKDYYVFMVLKGIARLNDKVIFKGGTSLSKAYNLIDRFSEDIDITLKFDENTKKISKGDKKRLSDSVINTLNLYCKNLNCGNLERTGKYNCYTAEYNSKFTAFLETKIKVETAFRVIEYPYENRRITSYITEYMNKNGLEKAVNRYDMEPFDICTVSIERTFIDKLFALGDYYLAYIEKRDEKELQAKSRHIYDLYKLITSNQIEINSELKHLYNEVKALRRLKSTACRSAQDNIILSELINEIMIKDIYKEDFSINTMGIIYKKELVNISYEKCKEVILNFLKQNQDWLK